MHGMNCEVQDEIQSAVLGYSNWFIFCGMR